MASGATTARAGSGERRGRVLDVLEELLAGSRHDEVKTLVARLVERNSELERLVAEAKSSRGRKNEGVPSTQLRLLLDGVPANSNGTLAEVDQKLRKSSGLDAPKDEKKKEKKPRAPRVRQPLPEQLRRVENLIPVPAEQRPCPKCGTERVCIGHDVTEVVDLIPAEVIVRLDKREKLACTPCEGELVRAPLGDKVVAGGKMGTTLVAQELVDKYHDGLPLSRQVERFERLHLTVAISTLADQVRWGTDALRPLWRAAKAKVLGDMVMHLDGTSLPVLDRDHPDGIRTGTIWGYVGTEVGDGQTKYTALCLYASTGKAHGQREGELGPAEMLALRSGRTVADASGLFDGAFKREGLVECGCNMHARRYFVKALDAGDSRAALPLAAFKKLYAVEREVKTARIEQRLLVRQTYSKPVYDDLMDWAAAHRPHEPPSSGMGRAIQYLTNHQLALRRFLGDGVIPIDNGVVERLHVRTALTRKNFLFAGSDAGAERAAIAFTILGCCALADVDPVEYLSDVLPRLATRRIRQLEMPELLPAPWKLARGGTLPVLELLDPD